MKWSVPLSPQTHAGSSATQKANTMDWQLTCIRKTIIHIIPRSFRYLFGRRNQCRIGVAKSIMRSLPHHTRHLTNDQRVKYGKFSSVLNTRLASLHSPLTPIIASSALRAARQLECKIIFDICRAFLLARATSETRTAHFKHFIETADQLKIPELLDVVFNAAPREVTAAFLEPIWIKKLSRSTVDAIHLKAFQLFAPPPPPPLQPATLQVEPQYDDYLCDD